MTPHEEHTFLDGRVVSDLLLVSVQVDRRDFRGAKSMVSNGFFEALRSRGGKVMHTRRLSLGHD